MVSPIIFYEEPCYGVSRAGSTLWKSSRSFQNNQGSVILRFLIVGKGFNRSKDFTYWIGRGQILFKAAVAKLRTFVVFRFGDAVGKKAHTRADRKIMFHDVEVGLGNESNRQISLADGHHLSIT